MTVVIGSFGGGTNSAAMYIGMVERGEPAPRAILCADTGDIENGKPGEKPHTYEFIWMFSLWLELHGYPPITMVRKSGPETLEENCLRLGTLPAIAYGFKTCSQRYKIEPQDRWCNNDTHCRFAWDLGEKVVKLVGYDFDELHRARFYEDEKYAPRYPLIDWRWGRADCVAAIARAGLPQPGKSACFFCPHTRKPEITRLQTQYPELLERALKLEANVAPEKMQKVKGLGRRFSWREFLAGQQVPDDDAEKEMPCGCYDGEEFFA